MQKDNKYTKRPISRRRGVDLGATRKETFGEWLFTHRIGLIVVLIALVVGGLWLMTARYSFTLPPTEYIIEFVNDEPTPAEVEELKRKRDVLQDEIDRRLQQIQKVQNLQSNDAAESSGSSSSRSESHDSETEELMDKIASDMAANRREYESGMRDVNSMGKGGEGDGGNAENDKGERGKYSGAVTVAYKFTDPVRHHRDLYVPAYRSRGGGIVVVDVWLDRNGKVTQARIASSTNKELNQQALEAARHHKTLFKIDGSAPASQQGTITYTFVAQ